jgi:hypothetical protein
VTILLLRGSIGSFISSEIAAAATFGGWARIKFPHIPEKPPEEVVDVKVKSLSTLVKPSLPGSLAIRWGIQIPFTGYRTHLFLCVLLFEGLSFSKFCSYKLC